MELSLTTPNYKDYSLEELQDALVHIDREAFPERTELLEREIANRTQNFKVDNSEPEFKEELHPNFIVRYWRGQVSLPISYWVMGIIANILVYAVSSVAEKLIESASHPVEIGAYVLSLYISIISLVIWQAVGVFRSAGFHPLRGGSKGWAVAARAMVVVGVLGFTNQMYTTGIPIMSGAFKTVIGIDRFASTQFRLLNEGKDLELFGGIEVGFRVTTR